jgi:hypothetical protein
MSGRGIVGNNEEGVVLGSNRRCNGLGIKEDTKTSAIGDS